MPDISNFAQVHQLLERFVPPGRSMRGAYTLDRMQQLMAALGNPQHTYKVIHVAGTSGKTSTAYYVAALLQQSGQRIGLTVSPHIDEVNERVQINLKPLSEKKFCKELSIFMNQLKKTKVKPTYFELLVAFAYWEFARQAVDYAVIEVGVGGLLDGTNVINRPDKICVITDIGLDHTELLGNSLTAITAQKAGIIHPHNAVFMYEQEEAVMQVIREVCEQQHASLHEVWSLQPGELPRNLVLFQRRNWYLALMVYDFISTRDNLPDLDEAQLATSTTIVVPARMEIVVVGKKTVILDGAHNAQKMLALAASMKRKYGKQHIAVLLSLVQSKNFKVRTSLEQILGIADHLIITSFETQQDMRKKSVNPIKVAEHCIDLGFESITIVPDPVKAYKSLLDRPEPILLITGSFYLLNHIRPIIKSNL